MLSIVNRSEAAGFCGKLSSCGLTLASVYTINWVGVGYAPVILVLGLMTLVINVTHISLILLSDLHDKLVGPFEVSRRAILSKQDHNLTSALKTVSIEFINYYLTDWQYIQQPVNNRQNYHYGTQLSYKLEQDDVYCGECQQSLFYTPALYQFIRLQCGHEFHQSCILKWVIAPTNAESECPVCLYGVCNLK